MFDEAHKLAAHFFGNKMQKTGRFKLAEKLGAQTRHLLLMTATPHSGKEEDFQLFLSLLDSDRFYGLNQAEKFLLAIVQIDENEQIDGPYYLRSPFDAEPGWGVSSVNYNIEDLLALAEGNQ